MDRLKLYLVHPISGLSYEEVVRYYRKTEAALNQYYQLLSPMTAKGYLRNELEFKTYGYDNPVSTNHAIAERDRWMVSQAHVVYADFTVPGGIFPETEEQQATRQAAEKAGLIVYRNRVSIGSVAELAWASDAGKHTVVAMETLNEHRHAFILEMADIVFDDPLDAKNYLKKLSNGGL